MTERKSFVLYYNYAEAFEMLSMEERGQLISAVFEHEVEGEVRTELSSAVKMAFLFIRGALDRDREAYEAKCQKNRESAKKGGRPRKNDSVDSAEAVEAVNESAEAPVESPIEVAAADTYELSDAERRELCREGVPTEYYSARLSRAYEYAKKHGKRASDVLIDWWRQDKRDVPARSVIAPPTSAKNAELEDWFAMRCEAVLRDAGGYGDARGCGGDAVAF